MKIINIFNAILKGENVPNVIKYNNKVYQLADDNEYYSFEDKGLFEDLFSELKTDTILNEEVEVLEITLNTKDMNITYQDNKLKEKMSKLQSEIDKLGNQISQLHNEAHSLRDSNTHMKNKLRELMKMVN